MPYFNAVDGSGFFIPCGGFQCIAYDQRGFARSDCPKSRYGAQDYMALQNAIAEAKTRAMQASHSSGNPMADFNRAREHEMNAWNSNHPANPWHSGSDKPN
jgi:hypothetical protein